MQLLALVIVLGQFLSTLGLQMKPDIGEKEVLGKKKLRLCSLMSGQLGRKDLNRILFLPGIFLLHERQQRISILVILFLKLKKKA